ncbi:SLC5A6 [Mytilus edulis]|uniref:SLC5A6 n=1 Tax=Mytilus edulis TaxID=6550 RepID=A0A8S3Q3W2_MYTED|nr:SLC5A6 [Mytilus edulis]
MVTYNNISIATCKAVCELCPGELIGTLQTVDYCIVVAVLVISVLIGIYFIYKEKNATADDMLMGGRDIGIFPIAMSLMASCMSTIFVLGTPAEMYTHDTSFGLSCLAIFPTTVVTCHVFMPFFHKLDFTSAYELLYMGVVLYAPSLALNQVTGLKLELSIVCIGLVCTFYTALGGLRAVVWTDTFQTFVVMAGLIAIIVVGSRDLGGFGEVWDIANKGGRIQFIDWDPNPTTRHSIWALIIGSFFGQLTIYAANQTMIQRYLAIKEIKNSQKALYLSLPLTLILSTVVCLVGLVIYATYHDCDPYLLDMVHARDQLLPFLVMDKLTFLPGLPGLFVACLFSASLSSISSGLNALAIVILEDVLKLWWDYRGNAPSPLWQGRIAKLLGLFAGGLVIGIAFLSQFLGQTVLQIMLSIFGMVGGPLLGLFISGIFFPFINSTGALCGLITSAVMAFWVGVGGTVLLPVPEVMHVSTEMCSIIQRNCSSSSNSTISSTISSTIATTTQATLSSEDNLAYFVIGFNEPEDVDANLIHRLVDRVCCFLPVTCQRVHRLEKYKDDFELATVNGAMNHGFESSETKMYDFGEKKLGGVIYRNGESKMKSQEKFTQL